MHFGRKLLTSVLLVSIVNCFTSFASVDVDLDLVRKKSADYKMLSEYVLDMESPSFTEQNGILVNKNKNGIIYNGWSFDINGDLYYTANISDGILRDTKYNTVYFDNTGKFINPAKDINNKFVDKLYEYESGHNVTFENIQESMEFMQVYWLDYSLNWGAFNYNMHRHPNGEITITMPDEYMYNRQELENNIINTFGLLKSETAHEKIVEAVEKIKCMNYVREYKFYGLDKAVNDKSGACWQLCKIIEYLLEQSGVETEIIYGQMAINQNIVDTNSAHTWLRSKVDNRWVYYDPTMILLGNDSYIDINYTTICNRYIPMSMFFMYEK